MAIITAQVLSACGTKPEERESRAKAALKKKYQKEFEIVCVYPQKFGDLYYVVQAYAVDDPDIRFKASIDSEDDGLSDTYVEKCVCSEIAETVGENLKGLQGYYFVHVRAIGPQPICGDPDIGIAEYAQLDPQNRFRAEIFLIPEALDARNIYRSMTEMFGDMEYLRADAKLVIVDEEQMENVQEQLESGDSLKLNIKTMLQDCFTLDIPFEDQKIGMSERDFIAKLSDAL